MKYPVLASFAFGLSLLAFSCQNSPASSSDASSTDISAGIAQTSSSVTPASDPNKLSEQILTDMLAGKAMARKVAPTYEESFNVIKSMKLTGAPLGESERAKIMPFVQDASKFRSTLEAYQTCTDKLDSLSTWISTKKISIEDAQKEYLAVRDQMKEAEGKLPDELDQYQSAKKGFEQAYPNAVKQ